jgi:class 3 adenylate cyclase
MMRPLFNAAKRYFSQVPDNVDIDKYRYYFSDLLALMAALVVHVILLIVFWMLNITPLFIFNLCSIAIFTTGIIYLRKGKFMVAYCLLGIEFTTHQALCVILIGWDSGMQYWLISMSVGVMLLIENRKIAIFISFILACEFVLLDLYFRNATPVYLVKPESLKVLYYYTISSALSTILAILFYYGYLVDKFEHALRVEYQKSDHLLHNVLPVTIANRLKEGSQILADGFDKTSILFADIVGFTQMSQQTSPAEVVSFLNGVFSMFDDLTEKYGLEKIKTIGDAYMVAGGIPEHCKEHAELIAQMALAMVAVCGSITDLQGKPLKIRIGINSGPVTAGVIGKKKFIYDLWGDAVNTASRMESHGIPGEIQVTQTTYELLKDKYEFCIRGELNIKGKGKLTTYLLKNKLAP